MLKSRMDFYFFDLVFPMKLKPLTYKAPKTMADSLSPGSIVEAELKKTIKHAVVLGKRDAKDFLVLSGGAGPGGKIGNIKTISSVVDCPALGKPLIELIKWMAGYYMAPEGSAIKVMWGGEVFGKDGPQRKRKKTKKPAQIENLPAASQLCPPQVPDEFAAGLDHVKRITGYGAFLLHAPEPAGMEFLLAAIRDETGVIVTCPEKSRLSEYEAAFRPVFGSRLCMLHGGLTPAQRRLAYERILKGEADIVLGTRVAVFAPLKKVSLIAVTGEENKNYKNQEDVKYGAREVAVMRAWLEKARVVLSSECPSAESYMNTLKGKYGYIRLEGKKTKTVVRILKDFRKKQENENKNKETLPAGDPQLIDNSIKDALSNALRNGKSALLLADRQGHSVPYCEECGHFERCPTCGTALVFHKKGSFTLSCYYCGHSCNCVPDTCNRCGGHNLKPLGAGTERLAEELKKLLPMAAVETGGERTSLPQDPEETTEQAIIFLGTKNISRKTEASGAGVAALIYPESAFFQPGFRARERLFAEVNHIAGRLSPGGVLYIQTKTPELFRAMKGLDYESFIETELEERKVLGYPPFSKLAHISIKKADKGELSISNLGNIPEIEGVEILGPVQKKDEKGKKFYSILIKAPSAQALKKAVSGVLGAIKSGKVTVDIDPV